MFPFDQPVLAGLSGGVGTGEDAPRVQVRLRSASVVVVWIDGVRWPMAVSCVTRALVRGLRTRLRTASPDPPACRPHPTIQTCRGWNRFPTGCWTTVRRGPRRRGQLRQDG